MGNENCKTENRTDYQTIILRIREILNNEDLCAEAMISEIGELVF